MNNCDVVRGLTIIRTNINSIAIIMGGYLRKQNSINFSGFEEQNIRVPSINLAINCRYNQTLCNSVLKCANYVKKLTKKLETRIIYLFMNDTYVF